MKKILFFTILIIVLVSLNWFKSAFAADLNSLSDEQKQELLKKYQSTVTPDKKQSYQTADFGESASERFNRTDTLTESNGSDEIVRKNNIRTLTDNNRVTDFAELKPFGMELFEHVNEQTDIPIDFTTSDDYILGPGDNVIIYLWGRVEKEFNLTIDREGKVFIPEVGKIYAWGLSMESFIQAARKKFETGFSDFELTASLGKIRSIRIYVAGEVNRPGAYTVSSLTSMLNALYLSGGPTERGSMRSIRLMRNGKAVSEIDLYKLLLNGDNSSDIQLNSGDVVFVPVAGPQVAIRGEIRRPALYELNGDETMSDLFILAGNPTPNAHLERVSLERVSDFDEWKIVDINMKDVNRNSETSKLQAGDRITVFSIFEAKQNVVSVFGQVKHAGYFEREDSTRVSDMIAKAKLYPYDVYFDRVDLFRKNIDGTVEIIPVNLNKIIAGDKTEDIFLQNKDSLHVYSIKEVEWDKYVYIEGEIKKPGRYPLYSDMSVNDLIFLAGSFTRSAQKHSAEIARIDNSAEVSLCTIGLDTEDATDFPLQEDDHIYIRQIPEWDQNRSVTIKGAVKYPGEYTLASRQETLYELLNRVGGFIDNSFPRGIVFERRSIKSNLDRLRVNDVIERSSPIKLDSMGNIVEETKVEYDSLSMNRIIIDMEKILSTNGTEGDIILEPDDHIFIPTVPSGISILGAVGANGTMKYRNGLSVKDYVQRAGNFTKQADKKQTRLIKATGEVHSGGGILSQRVEIGDVIVVPTKIEKEGNFLKSFTTALSAATGVLTSVYIISKL